MRYSGNIEKSPACSCPEQVFLTMRSSSRTQKLRRHFSYSTSFLLVRLLLIDAKHFALSVHEPKRTWGGGVRSNKIRRLVSTTLPPSQSLSRQILPGFPINQTGTSLAVSESFDCPPSLPFRFRAVRYMLLLLVSWGQIHARAVRSRSPGATSPYPHPHPRQPRSGACCRREGPTRRPAGGAPPVRWGVDGLAWQQCPRVTSGRKAFDGGPSHVLGAGWGISCRSLICLDGQSQQEIRSGVGDSPWSLVRDRRY